MESPSPEPGLIHPGVIHSRKVRRQTVERRSNGTEPTPGNGHAQGRFWIQSPKQSSKTEVEIVPVEEKDHLGLFSTTALILNKIIGTGIYVSPKTVLGATGSKGISLMIWLIGCVMTWAGLYIYLEYGMRWPVTGGELYYVDNVIKKPKQQREREVNGVMRNPKRLPGVVTYVFASMFILINGVQGNALQFGKEVIIASSPNDTAVNESLQKLFAILIITFICQLQAYSRFIYIRIGNLLALLKVTSLLFISLCGIAALAQARQHGTNEIQTAYGPANLSGVFASASNDPYQYGLALLSVMRAFLGYENANFVLAEVRGGPDGDKTPIFRRAVITSVATTCMLYIMVNVAFFAVLTTEEIIDAPDTTTIFLQKVFGLSNEAPVGAAVMIAFSAGGSVIALTFANALVKQEIARMGMVPFPQFWSETSHRRTPAHALFLHWIFSVICIAITPLSNPAGFLIMSTLYSYVHTYISIVLGVSLLCAPWISAFHDPENDPHGQAWKPRSSVLGWWLLGPLVIIYIASNAFVLILSWFPGNLQQTTHSTAETLPYYTGPVTGLGIIGFGILWWSWDNVFLPWLGYQFWIIEDHGYNEQWGVETLKVRFYRDTTGPAKRIKNFCRPGYIWAKKVVLRDPT